jgi:deoxyribodipyrimidine photo-lyase
MSSSLAPYFFELCFLTILSARPVLTLFAARRLSSRPVTQWSSSSSSRSSSSRSSTSSKAVVGMSEPLAKKLKEGPDALYAERTVQRLAPLSVSVHPKRVRTLKKAPQGSSGPVLYWMSREQRVEDNWALLYAVEQAREQSAQVAVVFNLVPEFMNAGARQFVFMLEGLSALERVLARKNIPFFLTQGDPVKEIPALVNSVMASTLVTDMSPLRVGRQWRDGVCSALPPTVSMHMVDAHNIVPVWVASDKREYAARTIRSKINGKLPEYLTEFPEVPAQASAWSDDCAVQPPQVDWKGLIDMAKVKGASVPPVTWLEAGEAAGARALAGFLTKTRLSKYESKRNEPSVPAALSGLSPYFHFGQLSPQRAALEASKLRKAAPESVSAFLEESVVRRELSDNFCWYTDNYDSIDCAYDWAKETLEMHRNDVRDHVYTYEQLRDAKTHDPVWNASQRELTVIGKQHGFIRMYWAKKILEWTESPEQAIDFAMRLNDTYSLDGRDPNGVVGVMWSVVGLHDQGWKERPVFGKIRYMGGAAWKLGSGKKKFDLSAYISRVDAAVSREKMAAAR